MWYVNITPRFPFHENFTVTYTDVCHGYRVMYLKLNQITASFKELDECLPRACKHNLKGYTASMILHDFITYKTCCVGNTSKDLKDGIKTNPRIINLSRIMMLALMLRILFFACPQNRFTCFRFHKVKLYTNH